MCALRTSRRLGRTVLPLTPWFIGTGICVIGNFSISFNVLLDLTGYWHMLAGGFKLAILLQDGYFAMIF